MGTSVATCLLAAGHPVVGLDRDLTKRRNTKRHVLGLLREMKKEGLLKREPPSLINRLTISEDYAALADSKLVVESIIENLDTKSQVLRQVKDVVSRDAIIGSNTSAIPVTILQHEALHTDRVLGIHWAEPAHVTQFMEIICGTETLPEYAERVQMLARGWGKEPSLLRR